MTSHIAKLQCKRPVNLTLSEDVVVSAKRYNSNLSATVETLLLGDYPPRTSNPAVH
jgi:post-segregation antitoxin (ccd killing protein)